MHIKVYKYREINSWIFIPDMVNANDLSGKWVKGLAHKKCQQYIAGLSRICMCILGVFVTCVTLGSGWWLLAGKRGMVVCDFNSINYNMSWVVDSLVCPYLRAMSGIQLWKVNVAHLWLNAVKLLFRNINLEEIETFLFCFYTGRL